MEENILSDKAAACLLGIAIGEGMGIPADGLTPYEVLSRFGRIAGFFPGADSDPGDYGRETKFAGTLATALCSGSIPDLAEIARKAREGIKEGESGRLSLSSSAVVSLSLRVSKTPVSGLVSACKAIASGMGLSPADTIAVFSYAFILGEAASNSASLSTPYDNYESDNSLLARTIAMCAMAEGKVGIKGDERVSEKLLFVRHKLGNCFWDSPRVFAVLGQKASAADAAARAIYAFLRTPDDFSAACDAASLGGCASLNAALVGGLVGAYGGVSRIPPDLSGSVKNGMKIEAVGKRLGRAGT